MNFSVRLRPSGTPRLSQMACASGRLLWPENTSSGERREVMKLSGVVDVGRDKAGFLRDEGGVTKLKLTRTRRSSGSGGQQNWQQKEQAALRPRCC
ncbi:hypothetical protein GCM10010914_14510 [Deinococcus wulumuqiensis]|uniref:Uncharacterized protein n=1 Tax=Deinococcus wulumuqiensis TaxID=980427 RepID=A0AAV4K8J1_9DEIO|nr:hypothetical protein GCM10010914_14510 [Deinococcus wulumuqiensis]